MQPYWNDEEILEDTDEPLELIVKRFEEYGREEGLID